MEEEAVIQKHILDKNKEGMAYLTKANQVQALQCLKTAQREVQDQLRVTPDHPKTNQLAGITYNNLACYYKKNGKPKVALSYLKKALQLQVYKVEDWTSTATTHLNICAIYSHLHKHQDASQHAELAIQMLQKVDPSAIQVSDNEKSYWNIKMLCYYNLAVELEHLKKFVLARKNLQLARETALKNSKKNQNMVKNIDESIQRVDSEEGQMKRKLSELLAKKKVQEERGNHQFMRKNKKHYGDQAEWRAIVENRKYELYKTDSETNTRRNYQSTDKVRRLAPLPSGGRTKRTPQMK